MNTSEPFYITTPIYYVNDKPHLGHAYASIHADMLARFHRLLGRPVFFLTGADEHGEKIAKAAAAAGEAEQDFVDRHAAAFVSAWQSLAVAPDHFVRTSSAQHQATVQAVLQRLFDAGEIYLANYEALYSVGQERFVTEKELVDGKLPEDRDPPQLRSEPNYFFRMEQHRAPIRQYLLDHPELIQPAQFRNEILQILNEPIGDLSISRPVSRLAWGIPLPFDAQHVTYVWFDALLSYVSPLGFPAGSAYQQFWPAAHHVIGKDILRTHTLFWLAMCRAIGITPYRKLLVSGYLLGADGRKMSKSLGNGVDPLLAAAEYGVDALRYTLLTEVAFGRDGVISNALIERRLTGELADELGNLLSRTVQMVRRYCAGIVPAPAEYGRREQQLITQAIASANSAIALATALQPGRAIEEAMNLVRALNRYVNEAAPWRLAKDESNRSELQTVLYVLLEGLRLVSEVLYPAMPGKMAELRQQLGLVPEPSRIAASWGQLPAGLALPGGAVLFVKKHSQVGCLA